MGVYNVSFPDGQAYRIESNEPPSEELLSKLGGPGYQPGTANYSPVLEQQPQRVVPYSQQKAANYRYLTNQDLKDISDSWTTSGVTSFLLGGVANNFLTLGFGSDAVAMGLGALGFKESAERVRAWDKIQEQEHPWLNLAGAATGAVATTVLSAGATAASGGTAGAGATALAAGRWAKVGQLASKAARPAEKAFGAAKKVGTATTKAVTQTAEKALGRELGGVGNFAAKTAGRMAEAGTIALEFEGAQIAGTLGNWAAGTITADQAVNELSKEAAGTLPSVKAAALLGGVVFPAAGVGGRWANKVYNYARKKVGIRQADLSALRDAVGEDALNTAVNKTRDFIKEGSEKLASLPEGSAQRAVLEQQLNGDVQTVFWNNLISNTSPEGAAVLAEVVKKNPTLRDRVLTYFAPTQKGISRQAEQAVAEELGVVSEQINKTTGATYVVGEQNVVKNLSQEQVNDFLGRSERMKPLREAAYSEGLDEVQLNIQRSGEGLFEGTSVASDFKNQSGEILRSAKTNTEATAKVQSKISLDEIPSLRRGTPDRLAFDARVEKEYVNSLRARAKMEADNVASEQKLSVEQRQAIEDQIFDEFNKNQRARQDNYVRRAIQKQNEWFDDVTTMGTNNAHDLNYLKDIVRRALPEEVQGGSQTPWGRVHTEINNLFRRYSGPNGKMTEVLDKDLLADTMDTMYQLGKRYGKSVAPLDDKRALQTGLELIGQRTPNPTNNVEQLIADMELNKAGGLAFFKMGLLEQAQDAALKGDLARLADLRSLMSSADGAGLFGYITPGELASTFENLVPIARAAKNTNMVLAAARGTSAEAIKEVTAPEVRFIVSTLTGGTNTALNALVTILDRGQWGPKIADKVSNVLQTGTVSAWNDLLNDVNKDPVLRAQFGRYLDMFIMEMKPRIEGAWGAGIFKN